MKQLQDSLQKALEAFLSFNSQSVDDGTCLTPSYRSPEEVRQVFEDWIDELVVNFVAEQDWLGIWRERMEVQISDRLIESETQLDVSPKQSALRDTPVNAPPKGILEILGVLIDECDTLGSEDV